MAMVSPNFVLSNVNISSRIIVTRHERTIENLDLADGSRMIFVVFVDNSVPCTRINEDPVPGHRVNPLDRDIGHGF